MAWFEDEQHDQDQLLDYYDYSDWVDYHNLTQLSADRDWGWDSETWIPVPAFGFMPASVDKELNAMSQVLFENYFSKL